MVSGKRPANDVLASRKGWVHRSTAISGNLDLNIMKETSHIIKVFVVDYANFWVGKGDSPVTEQLSRSENYNKLNNKILDKVKNHVKAI